MNDERIVQVQLGDIWLKLDQKHGLVLGSASVPFEDVPVYELKPKRVRKA